MKSINLVFAKNHVELTAYQTSNNFGDQIIEFVYEHTNGHKSSHFLEFPEGNWIEFTKENLLKIYKERFNFEFHKTVLKSALKYKISIKRSGNGHYYIGDNCSLKPTAKSGLILIKKYLRGYR